MAPKLKSLIRWFIPGATLLFLVYALKTHWQEVTAIRMGTSSLALLTIALGVTLLAHIWAAWVWSWLLQHFHSPQKRSHARFTAPWLIQVYLTTNLAKYLPGNVWHFYGRIRTVVNAGAETGAATLSVVLEPLLMAAAALLVALVGAKETQGIWQVLSLIAVLSIIHPVVLNPIAQTLGRLKLKKSAQTAIKPTIQPIRAYPLRPLFGELGFLGLRGAGFCLTLLAIVPVYPDQVIPLLSAFSFAWLMGLIVPGAPGGVGVFEATALALLGGRFSTGALISAVALYRLISILAETLGAGLSVLDEQRRPIVAKPTKPILAKPTKPKRYPS